jgi:hypothetical protein
LIVGGRASRFEFTSRAFALRRRRAQVPIGQGIALTYPWIEEQVQKEYRDIE